MNRNQQIIALRKEGVGPREIARRMGVSANVVAGVLHRAGIAGTFEEQRAEAGRRLREQCADRAGATVLEVAQTAMRMTDKAAADHFGIATKTVQIWRLHCGLRKPLGRPRKASCPAS